MKEPFFSIIIPTKNRPELLRDAISSVLLQNFDDYELIISDNFNDERTVNVVNEFKNNKHLNYIRTDKELNMPDHWEFATRKAKGIYILILTNRSFLRQGSLNDIYNSILESGKNIPVCFWNHGHYDEKNKILFGEKEQTRIKFLESKNLIKDFSQTLDARFLPKPCYGCYRRDFSQRIIEKVGRLYLPVNPDYTSALLFLTYSDFVMYIPRTLFFFQGDTISNFASLQLNAEPYVRSLDLKNPYQFVPIKAPISSNLIFNDFLTINNLVDNNFRNININWVFYFSACYKELRGIMTIPWADKNFQFKLLAEWKRVLSSFDEKTQKAVRREIRHKYKDILKAHLRSSFLGDYLVRIKRFLLGKPTLVRQTVLEAGNFKEPYNFKNL